MEESSSAEQPDRFLLRFMGLAILAGTGVGLARVATAVYAMDLGASSAEMGIIASAQSIGLIIMSLPMGMLIEVVGPRRLFSIGSALAGAIYLAVPLLRSTWFLLACMALVSFCLPSRFVSLNTIFFKHLAEMGAARAGWFRGAQTLGVFLLGPLLAGVFVAELGFPATYALISLSFLASILVGQLVLTDVPERPGGHGAARPGRAGTFGQLRLLGENTPLLESSLLEMSVHAAHSYFSFFIVPVAMKNFGLGSSEAAALVSVQGLFFITALFTLGSLLDRLGQRRGYLTGLGASGAGLCLLGVTSSVPVLWAAAALVGLGLGMLQVANLSRFAQISTRVGRGRVAGVAALTGPGGGLVGSLLGGMLGQRVGLQGVFLVLVPIFIAFGWRIYARSEA